ncbi:MAG: serine hydrolase [bacterium]|nr:serine hydrolase [bacterium]
MMARHRLVALCSTLVLTLVANPAPALADEATVQKARVAMEAGRFAEAKKLLQPHLTDSAAPVTSQPAILVEIMRRIRMDYALSKEEMLNKLRQRIPDVTAGDIERWRRDGVLQHRVIDGETRYFHREPSNLFRFCPEAADRRSKPPAKPAGKFDLTEHVARLVRLAEASPDPEIFPVRHRVTYSLKVKDGHPRLRPGAKVRCWLPYPREYRQQKDVRLANVEPFATHIASKSYPHRTIHFEQTIEDPAVAPRFSATYEFVTSAYCPQLDPESVRRYTKSSVLYREYTMERPPHLVFTPEIRQVVKKVAGDESNPLLRTQALFRWVCENVRYCSEMEYSTLPNIPAKALSTRRGDCGVQSLLFITLCRAAGIPARWQSGWESLPGRANMHDWAEFHVEPWGWLPADPSYGLQDHADPRVRGFYCGHLDPYRMIVNIDHARDLAPPKTSFRSEPNDFQRGEIEIDGHNLYFDEWDWTFDVQTLPLGNSLVDLEEALDAVVPDLLKAGHLPGAIVAVGRKTPKKFETWQKSYGFLRTEPQPQPMPDDALFDLASMTKPIATGTSLLVLLERGEITLDDPVGKYLPEFNEGDKTGVTIRHLMTHMSGMKPYVGAREQTPIKKKHGFPCKDALRKHIRELKLSRPPGKAVVYSCLNAILTAEVVEAVTGQPLDRFSTESIFAPLRMTETMFNPPPSFTDRTVPSTRAKRGRGPDGFLQGQVHDPLAAMQAGVSGNAGLFGTVADLHRYAQMMLNGGTLDGVRILKAETVQLATTVQNPGAKNAKGHPDRRGLLWDIYQPDPGDTGVDALYAFGHTGYAGTAIRFYPQQGVYILAMTNRVHPNDTGKVGAFRKAVWSTVGKVFMNVE